MSETVKSMMGVEEEDEVARFPARLNALLFFAPTSPSAAHRRVALPCSRLPPDASVAPSMPCPTCASPGAAAMKLEPAANLFSR